MKATRKAQATRKAAPLLKAYGLGMATLAVLGAFALAGSPAVQAAPTTFALAYSGASSGNTASATGTITFDPALINNPGSTNITADVTGLTLTVTGASSGNGTFTLADYNSSPGAIILNTNGGTLDFTKQLVGQPTSGNPFGTPGGGGGSFSLFDNLTGAAAGAPTAEGVFALGTDAGDGDLLLLTSFAPAAVPEPSTIAPFALGVLGLLGLTLRARRRSKAA